MSSIEIAKLTGKEHKNVLADIRKMLEEIGLAAAEFSATASIAGPNNSKRDIEIFNLPKRECLILVSGYSVTLRAKIVDRLDELESSVVKQSLTAQPELLNTKAAEVVARMMRLSDSASLLMLETALKRDGVDPAGFLPSYGVDAPVGAHLIGSSKPTAAITTILKNRDIHCSAIVANKLLEHAGLIERMQRPSATKGVKNYWSVTDVGLKYGKNVTSGKSQRDTQPHWYLECAAELVKLIGLEK